MKRLLHPLQAVTYGSMAHHDTLGLARRARGVDDIGQMLWSYRRVWITDGLVCNAWPICIQV